MTGFDLLPPDLLPSAPNLIAFALAALAVNLLPGPDMAFVSIASGRGGRHAGLAASLGIFVGCLVHIALTAFGLSALIAASQTAFTVLKLVGAAYLLWIAFGLLKPAAVADTAGANTAGAPTPQAPASAMTPARAFRQGILCNITNPKVALFFLAFLPQFIDPASTHRTLQLAGLGLAFNTSGLVVNAGVALSIAALTERLRHQTRLVRWLRWATAGIMGTLAVRLAVSHR